VRESDRTGLAGTHRSEEEEMAQARRTTHRSRSGKKLYAVRDANGRFKDIQTYERAHRADLAKTSKAEAGKTKVTSSKKGKRRTSKKA
jgi:hypothetical protein